MWAAAAVRLGSVAAVVAAVVAVLLAPAVVAVLLVLLPVLLLQVAVVLAQVPPHPLLLHLLPFLLLPQVVVESEAPLHLPGRQSFSAAMARSSPPTVPPTYERAPSTRSPPNVRTRTSACLNWMPVRG